jgi:hypothetical protein
MLSREVMGALALAILWVNTLLIAAAALKGRAALGRLGRSFGDVAKGTVVRGDGPAGALAALELVQVGRLGTGADPVILFHDRSYAGRVFGGRVAVGGGREVDVAPSEDAEVWLDAASVARAASCPSESAFASARDEARKARGFTRTVSAPIAAGAEVFVATRLVSTLDPRAWVANRTGLACGFVVSEILVAAACTMAALQRPLFGAVSTAGAAAGFVFFLLVQPAGTWVRDALRPPSRMQKRVAWTRAATSEPPAQATRSPS